MKKCMKNRVKKYRLRKRLTQRKLGELAGISQTTVSHMERGTYVPAVDTALRVAAVLGVSVEDLFILSERPEKYISM